MKWSAVLTALCGGLIVSIVASAQEKAAPGTIYRDPQTGRYTYDGLPETPEEWLRRAPSGCHICTRKPGETSDTLKEMFAGMKCRPAEPAGEPTDLKGKCIHGIVIFLCNPTTGLKVEEILSSDADEQAAMSKGYVPPRATFTEPHQ
jgi:hypothetical protein